MNCVLCQNDDLTTVSELDAKSRQPLKVSLCKNCGLVQQSVIPTTEELEIFYSHNYRTDYKKTYIPKSKHIYRAGKLALQRIKFLNDAGIIQGKLLDIGAGGGEFVYVSGKSGFDSVGVEPNLGYSEYAAKEYGCEVRTSQINKIEGKYDVITLFHVLEHLSSPLEAFEKLHSLLNKNGILFIEVPWIEAADSSPHNIFFKAHIFYFNVDTLIASASRYFNVKKVDTTSNLRILFEPKESKTDLKLPDPASVERLKKRMSEKGWLEYISKGKGLTKPFAKLKRALEEKKAENFSGKQILDELIS